MGKEGTAGAEGAVTPSCNHDGRAASLSVVIPPMHKGMKSHEEWILGESEPAFEGREHPTTLASSHKPLHTCLQGTARQLILTSLLVQRLTHLCKVLRHYLHNQNTWPTTFLYLMSNRDAGNINSPSSHALPEQ